MARSYHDFYKGSTILVTGGAGFIGSHLCDELVAHNASIRVLDDLSTGTLENLAQSADRIKFIHGSVENFNDCLQAADECTIIFHLAAQVSVTQSQTDPHSALNANVQGTMNILEAARIKKVKMVVFASSAAVYGNHEGLCSEEITPAPISTYGYSKLIGEQLCQLYTHAYGINTVSLRLFNVYGTRQNIKNGDGGVLALFNYKIQHNQPLTIFGNGMQTRDFVPVETVVAALMQAGNFDGQHANGQPFNIGTGTSVTLKSKLEEMLRQNPSYNQSITYLPDRPGDIKNSGSICSKFQKTLI